MQIKPNPVGAPADPDALHRFVRATLEVNIARTPLLPNSTAPFDYLCHAFFEGRNFDAPVSLAGLPARHDPDAVVWASRGGGKTFLAAIATLLDLVFKPGIEVHLLAGSVEQGLRMYQHLRSFFEEPCFAQLIDGKLTARAVKLTNGSRAVLLAQSETSVRGCRVQKLRCDEVELFDREVWSAAQLVTRSMDLRGPWGRQVRGAVDALSTMHRPFGLMWELVRQTDDASLPQAHPALPEAEPARARRIFKWSVLDVLEHCPPSRACETCALQNDCRGRAKQRPPEQGGHFGVADAVQLKSRVALPVWTTEMLCDRPNRSDSVFPEFNDRLHICPDNRNTLGTGTWLMGMDFGFRCPAVLLLAHHEPGDILRIVDERIEAECTVQEHLDAVRDLGWPRPAWIGIDPAGMQVSDQTGRSARDILTDAGYRTRQRRCEVHEGLMAVRARLRAADHARPRLLISSRCTRLIEAMMRYHYDVERRESLKPVKDGPDHAADALRYLITNLDRPGVRSANYANGDAAGSVPA